MDFDDTITDMDEVIDLNSMRVVVDKKSVLYLYGTQLEYSDGLNGKGFHWVNPNASRTCGCGESFSL
jgi:iron-sulfur cluster assembly protein